MDIMELFESEYDEINRVNKHNHHDSKSVPKQQGYKKRNWIDEFDSIGADKKPYR